jgi:hypothetical protein
LEALRNDKQTIDLFEEAEFGFRKVEFGDHELDTLFWVDILQFLGEFCQTLCKPLNIILKKMKSNTV